jgi:uncharacterized protein (TIGR02453 family)
MCAIQLSSFLYLISHLSPVYCQLLVICVDRNSLQSMKNSLDFLAELAQNNHKDWFSANKSAYEVARAEFLAFATQVWNQLSPIDPAIAGLEIKKTVFRLHRDVRFSKNKDPFKTNFGMFFAEGGRNSGNPGYYFHLQPGDKSFVAGGIYMPAAETLAAIRQEIDYNGEALHQLMQAPDFQRYFSVLDSYDSLKRPPKGYPADHPDVGWLKLKSFTISHRLTDKEILSQDLPTRVTEIFGAIKPFNDFLREAIAGGD